MGYSKLTNGRNTGPVWQADNDRVTLIPAALKESVTIHANQAMTLGHDASAALGARFATKN
jgi:hypothetical protein